MDKINISSLDGELLQKIGVKALVLFGSQARGLARSDSDFDFGVMAADSKETYDQLYNFLSAKINKLVNIDIVFLNKAPLELAAHTAKYGQLLYEEKSGIYADFCQKTMINCADFSYYRHMFQQATLDRIS